jgi:mannose-6-phosphate isomerase-like protein (cupin superfamily)
MKQITAILFFSLLIPVGAAEPPGFAFWSATELKGLGKKLSTKMNEQKLATEELGKFVNHSIMAVHREGSGEAEVHEMNADVFVVESGQGTLVVGGKVVGAKTTTPGEIRGVSIQGGERKKLGPGDIVNIPANIPHQVLLGRGEQITYLIVKVPK